MSTAQQIEKLVEEKVDEALRKILSALDFGADLKPEFVEQLKKSVEQEKQGKIRPLKEHRRGETEEIESFSDLE